MIEFHFQGDEIHARNVATAAPFRHSEEYPGIVSPLAEAGRSRHSPAMPSEAIEATLESVLGAAGQCLDRTSAEALLRLRADVRLQARIEDLADRCTEGTLSAEEREEYESLIRVGNFVAILQTKARQQLAAGHAA